MSEPLVSGRAVEFDGKIIGYIRSTIYGVYAQSTDNVWSGVFNNESSAHALLMERHVKSKIGDDEGVV